mgnify:CR=1 FL=1
MNTLYDVDIHFSVNKFSTTLDDDDERRKVGDAHEGVVKKFISLVTKD